MIPSNTMDETKSTNSPSIWRFRRSISPDLRLLVLLDLLPSPGSCSFHLHLRPSPSPVHLLRSSSSSSNIETYAETPARSEPTEEVSSPFIQKLKNNFPTMLVPPSSSSVTYKRNLDQLEALLKKLKAKTLRAEAPSQSIAATRLLA